MIERSVNKKIMDAYEESVALESYKRLCEGRKPDKWLEEWMNTIEERVEFKKNPIFQWGITKEDFEI